MGRLSQSCHRQSVVHLTVLRGYWCIVMVYGMDFAKANGCLSKGEAVVRAAGSAVQIISQPAS